MAIDWTKSMKQTFEFYTVNPGTWEDVEKLETVKSCTISRDLLSETLGSANFSIDTSVGEEYVRVYLIAIQNGITEKIPLGTFLIQTPSSSFDGKVRSVSATAYTPLLELKETPPALGYYVPKGRIVLETAYQLAREHLRAPVVPPRTDDDSTKVTSNYVANTDDTWLTYIKDLLSYAKYHYGLDEMSRLIFEPDTELGSMTPVYVFNDDDDSILFQDISMNHDIYGIPNVVEVSYTNDDKTKHYEFRVVNDDLDSPVSTVTRGREIIKRITSPQLQGEPSKEQVQRYATQYLKAVSEVQYTVTYSHGYCPVRIGDCVRLNYKRAGIENVNAKVISQSITCEPGCKVEEKAIFTTKLWEG